MIQVSGLSKSYGRQVLFDNVGFTVNPGERIGLVGRNGHGKTTLFRLITGEEHPDSGTITIPGGTGSEIVREVVACPECAAKLRRRKREKAAAASV